MIKLTKPTFDIIEIVNNCAESIRDSDKKERIQNASSTISNESKKYDSLASAQKIFQIEKHTIVNNNISSDEMISLYNDKFVKTTNIRKKYYDKIMLLSKGICPICDLGQVSNLDHYLPKSKYPIYAVTPYNLVPICRDCNSIKGDKSITKIEETVFHPYYDNIDDVIWLEAKLEISNGGLLATYCVSDKLSDIVFYRRCKNHLETYNLEKRYCIEAAREIADNFELWKNCFLNYGLNEFQFRVNEKIKSLETICKNSWKIALYRAIIADMNVIINVLEV